MSDPGSAGALHVYVARSEQPFAERLEQRYLALMPPSLRATIAGCRRWQDRQATLIGRLLLLRGWGGTSRADAARRLAALSFGRHGKPFTEGGPEFSIAHSAALVVVAFAEHGRLGIDVEKIGTVDLDDFANDLPELQSLRENPDQATVAARFYDCWTRKEAVLKASGEGLQRPLKEVMLHDDTAQLADTRWYLTRVALDAGYCCHLATDRRPGPMVIDYVDLTNERFLFDDDLPTKEW